jgi:hypothetical protein
MKLDLDNCRPVGVKPELFLFTIFHFLLYTEYFAMPWKFGLEKNYSTKNSVLLVPIYIVITGNIIVFRCSILFHIQVVVMPVFCFSNQSLL